MHDDVDDGLSLAAWWIFNSGFNIKKYLQTSFLKSQRNGWEKILVFDDIHWKLFAWSFSAAVSKNENILERPTYVCSFTKSTQTFQASTMLQFLNLDICALPMKN